VRPKRRDQSGAIKAARSKRRDQSGAIKAARSMQRTGATAIDQAMRAVVRAQMAPLADPAWQAVDSSYLSHSTDTKRR